jgi:hypothetical protein
MKPALERHDWPATKAVDSFDLIRKLQQSGAALNYFMVNVGAGDGCIKHLKYECDPVNTLLASSFSSSSPSRAPWRALLFDPSPLNAEVLRQTYANAIVLQDAINSSSIVNILSAHKELPVDFDVFKIDIDSADCDVIEALLSHGSFRPKVIVSEFNIMYPPPIHYNLVDDGKWLFGARFSKLYDQCSLAYLENMMKSHNYVLFQVDFWDAWFVRRDVANAHLGLPVYYDALSWFVAGYARVDYKDNFIEHTAYGKQATNGLSAPCLRWTDLVNDKAGRENRTLTAEEAGNLLREVSEFVPRAMQSTNNLQQYMLSLTAFD